LPLVCPIKVNDIFNGYIVKGAHSGAFIRCLTLSSRRHGNIKPYLHKYKIHDSSICSCKRGEQTIDHVIYDCKLLEEETDRLKAAVMWTDNWPVSKNNRIKKSNKDLIRITHFINFDKL
jgi:hypothetical protein